MLDYWQFFRNVRVYSRVSAFDSSSWLRKTFYVQGQLIHRLEFDRRKRSHVILFELRPSEIIKSVR